MYTTLNTQIIAQQLTFVVSLVKYLFIVIKYEILQISFSSDLQQSADAAAMANEFGFYANNANSSFDYLGWVAPSPGGGAGASTAGSLRRTQPQMLSAAR
jgi:hypothetical protein